MLRGVSRYRKSDSREEFLEKHHARILSMRDMLNNNVLPNFCTKFSEIWLEIGFGYGENIVHQARNNKNVGIIASEPYIPGLAFCLRSLLDHDERMVDNYEAQHLPEGDRLLSHRVMLTNQPAHILLPHLKNISKAFIMFPDPWQKRRHHKRRLVNAKLLSDLAQIMKNGAEVHVASDSQSYVKHIFRTFQANESFRYKGFIQDLDVKTWKWPKDWCRTRYQRAASDDDRPSAAMVFEFRR